MIAVGLVLLAVLIVGAVYAVYDTIADYVQPWRKMDVAEVLVRTQTARLLLLHGQIKGVRAQWEQN